MKIKIKKEYKQQTMLVLKYELNARNRIAAINTITVPLVLYSCRIIDWKQDEIQDLDRMATVKSTRYLPRKPMLAGYISYVKNVEDN